MMVVLQAYRTVQAVVLVAVVVEKMEPLHLVVPAPLAKVATEEMAVG
jgi:hypothetical protein